MYEKFGCTKNYLTYLVAYVDANLNIACMMGPCSLFVKTTISTGLMQSKARLDIGYAGDPKQRLIKTRKLKNRRLLFCRFLAGDVQFRNRILPGPKKSEKPKSCKSPGFPGKKFFFVKKIFGCKNGRPF